MERRAFIALATTGLAGCSALEGSSNVDSFKDALVAEGVDVKRLAEANDRWELSVYPDLRMTTSFRDDIETIAYQYGLNVPSGGLFESHEGLDCRLLSEDDTRFASFEIEASWARDYANEDYGWGTYFKKVLKTFDRN